jgi:putative aldouronate transport system permease protein
MLYLSDPKKVTLQLFLVNIVRQANLTDNITSEIIVPPDTVRAAAVVFGTAPILFFYPFLQKYFVKGITLGSVKG